PLPGALLLPLSAKSEPALREGAANLAAHLRGNPELDPADAGLSLATTRSRFERRAVILGSEREELLGGLDAFAAEKESEAAISALASGERRPAFLFPGQGSQWERMALDLIAASPLFGAAIEECEEALAPFVDWSLGEVLREEGGKWLDRLDIVQPALFAVMVSLARLWRACGVEPAVVVGHSQGEIAAAHVAGGLSLADAARIVALRSKALVSLAGKGGMASVSLAVEQILPRLEPFGDRLSLAAINGPADLVVSGDPDALRELIGACEADGIRAKLIAVDYASHSAQIDALREELLEAFAPISPRGGEIPFHSTVTGETIDTAELGAEYWFANLRQTVRLEPVTRALLGQGQRTLIEISPHPVLAFGLQSTIDDLGPAEPVAVLGSLRREQSGPDRFARSLAEAHVAGVELDWAGLYPAAKRVPLPTYPFQRERFWLAGAAGPTDAGSIGQGALDHPLLAAAIEDPGGERLTLTGRLSLATHPWLADHSVFEATIVPGTAFLEMALKAGELAAAETVEELTLQAPLVLSEQGAVAIQVAVGPEEEGRRSVSIHSRPETAEEQEGERAEWALHAAGTLSTEQPSAPEPFPAWPPAGAEPLQSAELYERLADAGFGYGPAFQGLGAAWQDGEEIYLEVSLAEAQQPEAARFAIHPALLDSALHGAMLGAVGEGAEPAPGLPSEWRGVRALRPGAASLHVRLSLQEDRLRLLAVDPSGVPALEVGSVYRRPVDRAQLAGQAKQGSLYRLGWQELSLPEAGEEPETTLIDTREWDQGDPVEASHAFAAKALAAIQAHLADETEESRLVFLTAGALDTSEAESPSLAAATLAGLLRSAASEHPGRFALIDSDG
ncbi:MAG TPA: type I polyketide synthase, partial [Solirubrobacterales bacterium]|nr:type I polyketide synthase [Solirubrobacterales bacterium]